MKTFKCTIEANNSCYVQTLLAIAEDEQSAHELICKEEKRTNIKYKDKLKEITIDTQKPIVIQIGFGENDHDNYFDD